MTTPQAASVPHETYATRFSFRPVALGRRGMVATANPLASLAGLKMFARGGNAVDALVAAAAAIGVAEPYMSGLAGCGVLVAHASRAAAPGAQLPRPRPGGHEPGEDARRQSHERAAIRRRARQPRRAGRASWRTTARSPLSEALEPAAELAEAGPPLTPFDRQMFDEHLTHLDAEAVRNYLHGGRTPAVGATLAQPNLAATFRRIGREGIGRPSTEGAFGEGYREGPGRDHDPGRSRGVP